MITHNTTLNMVMINIRPMPNTIMQDISQRQQHQERHQNQEHQEQRRRHQQQGQKVLQTKKVQQKLPLLIMHTTMDNHKLKNKKMLTISGSNNTTDNTITSNRPK